MCIPALLMLGRELQTPAELAFGKRPDAPATAPVPNYARRLQESLDRMHAKRRENYDVTTKGQHFLAEEG